MPRTLAHYLLLPINQFEEQSLQLHGFLDMLRYDQAQLIEASHHYVILRRTGHIPFTVARWHSFGLYPIVVHEYTDGESMAIRALVEQYNLRTVTKAADLVRDTETPES